MANPEGIHDGQLDLTLVRPVPFHDWHVAVWELAIRAHDRGKWDVFVRALKKLTGR